MRTMTVSMKMDLDVVMLNLYSFFSLSRVCLHQLLQADWSMRGPMFHLDLRLFQRSSITG